MRPRKTITLQPQFIQTSQLIERCRMLETSRNSIVINFACIINRIPSTGRTISGQQGDVIRASIAWLPLLTITAT